MDPAANKSLEHVFINALVTKKQDQFQLSPAEAAKLKAPTLVLWTDKNPGQGPVVGKRYAEAIPGSQYYCIMDAAHWPQWEHPEEHDRVVTEFLTS